MRLRRLTYFTPWLLIIIATLASFVIDRLHRNSKPVKIEASLEELLEWHHKIQAAAQAQEDLKAPVRWKDVVPPTPTVSK